MTSSQSRRVFGRMACYSESDFISEISGSLKEYDNIKAAPEKLNKKIISNNINKWASKISTEISVDSEKIRPPKVEREKFNGLRAEDIKAGIKVRHNKFGIGTIVSVNKSGEDIKLTIAFDKRGIKNLMYGIAQLEAV